MSLWTRRPDQQIEKVIHNLAREGKRAHQMESRER